MLQRQYRAGLPVPPARMQTLRTDARGYPVPWFVWWDGDKPDFRVIGPGKIAEAVRFRKCWVCGSPLGRHLTFLIGPMCAVNRTTAEPPAHRECADYSASACPFLTLPKAQRRDANLPTDVSVAGTMIKRNPGVAVCWTTLSYKIRHVETGVLFSLGDPIELSWWAQGRRAERAEILDSITSGLPILRAEAVLQGHGALAALDAATERGLALVPA
jgi:hypothetical protein